MNSGRFLEKVDNKSSFKFKNNYDDPAIMLNSSVTQMNFIQIDDSKFSSVGFDKENFNEKMN